MSKPKIVCLCGSTKFFQAYRKAERDLTMKGEIVLTCGVFSHSGEEAHGEKIEVTQADKEMLDQLHRHKIDLADYIFVINVGGYIGQSTRGEIAYAKAKEKGIAYLEPDKSLKEIA